MKIIKADKNCESIININLFENKVIQKSINKRMGKFFNGIFGLNDMKNKNNYKSLRRNKNGIQKQYNLGIQLLRAILCFWVVSFHCMSRKNKFVRIILKKHFHVPIFFIISFYY